jgi:hypothetical protein
MDYVRNSSHVVSTGYLKSIWKKEAGSSVTPVLKRTLAGATLALAQNTAIPLSSTTGDHITQLFTVSPDNATITILLTGYYNIGAYTDVPALVLGLNRTPAAGATTSLGANSAPSQLFHTLVRLQAGDAIRLVQTGAVVANITPASQIYLEMVHVSDVQP